MPVLNDLVEPLTTFLRDHPGATVASFPHTLNVELLLSSLAVDQPFLNEAQNLHNRALFVDVRAWLAQHVYEAQTRALARLLPEWLRLLVTAWHERQATVVTLNYDTLIEAAVMSMQLMGGADQPIRVLPPHTYAFPIEGPPATWADVSGSKDVETFTLCKLHGSISWWGRERGSAEPREVRLARGAFAPEGCASWDDVYKVGSAFGEPLLVPPTLTKSDHFDSYMLRSNWRRAFEGLRQASRIFVLGYSFPLGDTQMVALLGTTMRDTLVTVVDINRADVVRRTLEAYGTRSTRVTGFSESPSEPIRAFAERYARYR